MSLKILNLWSFFNGAEVEEVDEPLFGPSTVVTFEFEAYPEPKILTSKELQTLFAVHKSYLNVAKLIRVSEAFVRQNIVSKKKNTNQGS